MAASQGSWFLQAQGSQGAVEPALLLSTPCTPHTAHGSAGSAVGGFGPTAGAQTTTAPWPGFLSCLMAAGALNLSCGLSWVLRCQGGSAIPAMCPRSRISSEEKRYPGEPLKCSAAKVRAEGKLWEPSACWQSPDGICCPACQTCCLSAG